MEEKENVMSRRAMLKAASGASLATVFAPMVNLNRYRLFPYKLDGNPRLAERKEAEEILERLQRLSKNVGTNIEIRGHHAKVKL